MKNKKAQTLPENTLGIILAVIGIALIIFAVVKLYQFSSNQEKENAKKIIDLVEEKINAMKDGEEISFPFQGQKTWLLTGWSKDDRNRPDKCSFNSCICICPTDTINTASTCQKSGICREIDKKEIFIRGTPSTAINLIEKRPESYIDLPSNLVELKIYKTKDRLEIIFNS